MTANKYAFEHKVVLVTGAGSGMGRAIARAFLDNNATVIVTGRREQALKDTVATYPNEKVRVCQVKCVSNFNVIHIFELSHIAFHS